MVGLLKSLYTLGFAWIVRRVNEVLRVEAWPQEEAVLDLLDIFGFENFAHNSFEQLCINFANEKLQQLFNQHTFKQEEELYISEDIPYKVRDRA